jgi:hypothetical protein
VEHGPPPLNRPLADTRTGVRVIMGSGLGPLISLEEGKVLLDEITVDDDSTDWAASELLAPERMVEKLGISAATLESWRESGKVIAFRKDAHGFVYPIRQFDHLRPIVGLGRIVECFPSPEEAWEWLVTPNQYTDSAAPLDWLRKAHRRRYSRSRRWKCLPARI